jgi:Tetracyclin repressor-like, C-terminal domain
MTDRPLPRDRLPEGVERRAAAPLLRAAGDQDLARAVWASAHGMVQLELARRFPPGADLDSAWREGVTAFQARQATG